MVHHATFPSLPASPARARAFVRERLTTSAVPAHDVATLELVVSELVANAVEHGSGGEIALDLGLDDEGREVTMMVRSDTGEVDGGFLRGPFTAPDAGQRSGRGLAMVRQLVQELSASLDGQVLTVRVVLRVTS